MTNIANLTSLITAFSNETEQGSITPKIVGSLLQQITNALPDAEQLSQADTQLSNRINSNATAIQNEVTRATTKEREITNTISKLDPRIFKGKLYVKQEGYPTRFSLWTDKDFTIEFTSNYTGGEVGNAWRATGHSGGIIISSWWNLILITPNNYVVFEYSDDEGNKIPTSGDGSITTGGYWRKYTTYKHLTEDERTKWNKVITDLSTETTNRINTDTEIKNAVTRYRISNNDAINDVIKELYFDKWCNTSEISYISIKRNGSSAENSELWELYLVDKNGTSHWASFGKRTESQDVNVSRIGWQSDKTSLLFSESHRNEVSVYAVIDWSKITDQKGALTSQKFSDAKLKSNIVNNVKYHPQINTCITTHKYTHDVEANSIIKELYFENLTRNGSSITEWYLKNEFFLARIDRCVEDNGKILWQLVFGVKNDNGSGHFYIYTESSPEKNSIWKKAAQFTIGEVTYSGTIYAIIDWSKIAYDSRVEFADYLLPGCLKLHESPIINSYISSPLNTTKWSNTLNIDNYKTQGIYYISGERLKSESDHLPILNASSGHSISGQLTVLDASLSTTEQCITQYLKLSNRLGSEGKEYVRTYNKYSNGTSGWSEWREIKQTSILNQISDTQLKNKTENGTYEGAILNNTSDFSNITSKISTFLQGIQSAGASELPTGSLFTLEVLNNYAIVNFAKQNNITINKSITQRAKVLLVNGTYIEIQRTHNGSSWSNWKAINSL